MLSKETRKSILLNLLVGGGAKCISATDESVEFEIRARAVLECLLYAQNIEQINIANPDSEIDLIWSIEDVKHVRSNLSDEQALAVLQVVKKRHDATVGVSWQTLAFWADEL